MNTQKGFADILIIILVLLVVGGGIYVYLNNDNFTKEVIEEENLTIEDVDKDSEHNETLKVKIASAALNDEYDTIVSFEEVEIPKTKAVLGETLKYFFNYDEGIEWLGKKINFDEVILEQGIAKVYINGPYSGTDTGIQERMLFSSISETALQFSTVKDVELYINDETSVLYHPGSAFGLCFPNIDNLEKLPNIHDSGEYSSVVLTKHRYYKKGLILQLVYSGLRDDSVSTSKYQATLDRSELLLSELSTDYDNFHDTCPHWSLPAWKIGEWEDAGFKCAQGRGHQYFSEESCT